RGTQYLAVRYTQRLAEAGAVASVGTTGDSYDNALAEAFHSLFKAELIRNRGPWRNLDEVEIAVAEDVDWINHRRLHGETGLVPPAEFEDDFYQQESVSSDTEALVPSLYRTRHETPAPGGGGRTGRPPGRAWTGRACGPRAGSPRGRCRGRASCGARTAR